MDGRPEQLRCVIQVDIPIFNHGVLAAFVVIQQPIGTFLPSKFGYRAEHLMVMEGLQPSKWRMPLIYTLLDHHSSLREHNNN